MARGSCYTIPTEVPTGTFEVHLQGEIDLASVDELHQIVAAYARSLASHVVVDLGQVTFFDVTGLGLLVDLFREAGVRRGRFAVRNVPPMTRRIIRIAGLELLLAGEDRPAHADEMSPGVTVPRRAAEAP